MLHRAFAPMFSHRLPDSNMHLTRSVLTLIVVLAFQQIAAAQLGYNRIGSLDKTLNNVGYVHMGGSMFAGRTKQLSDRSIVLVGAANNNIQLIKLRYDGTGDTDFGSGGFANITCTGCLPTDLVELKGGKLVVVGQTSFPGTPSDIFLARLNANGSLDTTFGTNGFAIHDLPAESGHFSDESMGEIALLPDGSILTAAITSVSTDHVNKQARGVIVKFDANGALDASFGTAGFTQTVLGDESSGSAHISHISLLANGRIAAAFSTDIIDSGAPNGSIRKGLVMEYLPTGQIDSGFEPHWISGDYAIDIAGTADGGLLVLVSGKLQKFSLDGQLDTAFGSNGTILFPYFNILGSIAIQPSGKFYLTGHQILPTGPNLGSVRRYWPNGMADRRFGRNGSVLLNIEGEHLYLSQAFIESDGRIALTGAHPPNNLLYIRLITSK